MKSRLIFTPLAVVLLALFGFNELESLLVKTEMEAEPSVIESTPEFTDSVILDPAQAIYQELLFGDEVLDEQVFRLAYQGYDELLQKDKLKITNLLTVIDYSLSANKQRLWVVDLEHNQVVFNELVSHGKKSGEEFATTFSNQPKSHMSSLGFFVTGVIYDGRHDLSLKLHGMELGLNDKVYERGVVIHGAEYVSERFIRDNGRLGRSLGCPAVSLEIVESLIYTISNGSCVFIYYPEPTYFDLSELV